MPRPAPASPVVPRVDPRLSLGLTILVLLQGACASSPPPKLAPVDAESLALRLEVRGQLDEPTRIMFEWSLADRDARFGGRGVARVEPPYRARLDLFLSNGETVVRAALVGDDLRLPVGAPEGLVPPAELLWGALGVFRPSREAALQGGTALPDGRVLLSYRYPEGVEVRYFVRGGQVRTVERLRQGQVVERLAVGSLGEDRYPVEATYRNLGAFRELTLTRQTVEPVEAYPPDIWEVEP